MEDNKKRFRDESEINPPELKRVRVGSIDSASNSLETVKPDSSDSDLKPSKLVRADSFDSVKENRIPDELLDILDDSEPVEGGQPEIQDLDSVIRSFEEEILLPPATETVSDSGESQPELGYLLEASDDELGLPPTTTDSFETPPSVNSDMFGFQDEIMGYDPFGFGFGADSEDVYRDDGNEFVLLDGLFDSDFSEFLYRPESLPAL